MSLIHFYGTGTNFPFYFGVMQYLQENYILDNIILSGSSSGALIALICILKLDFMDILKKILEIQDEIIKNHGSLLFIWKKYLIDFYNDIIPEKKEYNNIEIIETKISFSLSPIQKIVSKNFKSKQQIIDSLLSSQHLPFLLDKNLFHIKNNEYFIDGVLSDYLFNNNNNYIKIPNYINIFRLASIRTKEEIYNMFDIGYNETKKLKEYYDSIFIKKNVYF